MRLATFSWVNFFATRAFARARPISRRASAAAAILGKSGFRAVRSASSWSRKSFAMGNLDVRRRILYSIRYRASRLLRASPPVLESVLGQLDLARRGPLRLLLEGVERKKNS